MKAEAWVKRLVIATDRHDATEASAQNTTGEYHWKRTSTTIPAGTIVLVVKETPQNIIFIHGENMYEASKGNYELCKPSEALVGKTFCFTGALAKPRDYFETLITLHGGEFKKTVTNDLNYLVMAFKNSFSRKAQAARDKGIICLEEDDLMLLIKNGQAPTPPPPQTT